MSNNRLPPQLRSGDFLGTIQNSPFNLPMNEQKFAECFFGFLDILGYKDFLKRAGDDAPRKIYQLLKQVYESNSSIYESVKLKLLSDSILLWTNGSDSIHFWNLLNVAELLRGSFLDNGLLLRGGVSIGKHFIHHDILVSPALVEAYALEQEALYPRILISQDALARGRRDMQLTIEGFDAIHVAGYNRVFDRRKVETDFDGKLVLRFFAESDSMHFFRTGRRQLQFAGDADPTPVEIAALQAALIPELERLQKKVKSTRPGEASGTRAFEKYQYVVANFNEWLARFGPIGEGLQITI